MVMVVTVNDVSPVRLPSIMYICQHNKQIPPSTTPTPLSSQHSTKTKMQSFLKRFFSGPPKEIHNLNGRVALVLGGALGIG